MILLETEDKNNVHTAEGNSQQIQGAGIIGLELYGNTQQNNLDSNNVFDGALELGALDYNTGQNSANNNSIRSKNYIPITPANFTFIRQVAFSSGKTIALRYYDANFTYIGRNTINNFTQSVTKETDNSLDTSKAVAYVRFAISGETDTTQNFCIRTDGNTTYNPPKPNPEKPQNINVVTGTQSLNICRKNLFDNTYGITSNVYTTHINANSPLGSVDCYPINLKPNTNYTLTVDMNGYAKTGEWIAGMCFANGNVISLLQLGSMSDITTTTFTTDSTGLVYVGHRYGFTAGTTGRMDLFLQTAKIQIEQGSTATKYQAYQRATYSINLGSLELCKIGDYQDYIYKENDKWYKKSYIKKLILDGSERWSYGTAGGYPRCTLNSVTDIMAYADTNRHIGRFLCSHFNPDITNGTGHMYQYQNTILCNPTNNITSLDAFKTWLNTNKPNLYYLLATPTNTEITDSDLISQLEAITNISLYDGENNIILSTTGLLGEYKIYYSDWYKFEKILRNGYIIKEDNDRITQKFANGHRKQFLSPYKDCTITLNLDTIDNLTTKEYLDKIKSGKYKYYSLDDNMYKISSFIIEEKPSLTINNSINNAEINDYQVKLLKAGD